MMRYLRLLCGAAGLLVCVGCQKAGKSSGAPPRMAAQVIAVPAKAQTVSETLSLVGSVAANEMVEIKSEIEGAVQEINFKEGERVEKGRLLVKLDDSKLQAAVSEAEASFKLAKSNLDRNKQLFDRTLISPQEFDQVASQFQLHQATLELKKSLLKDTRIVAPFAGVVGTRAISAGQVISKDTSIAWLVDLDPVKVEINVPERFLSQLKIGQTIEVIVSAFQNRKFKGEVFFIAPQVDPATRTAMVKARIPNPDLELKPGMFANLDLTLKVRDNSVVIPESALNQLQEGGRASVFVVAQDQTAQMRQVKLGMRLPGQVEVLEGIKAGEMVIVEGLQKIGPGAPVRVAQEEPKAKT
jgi:membrane fusion protein, multidrug efflux system